MKIEKNNVKIEITEIKDNKICIDITTSKEVVVNVKKENVLTGTEFRLVDVVRRKIRNSDNNEFFDSHDIEKRDLKNNKE